MSILESGVNALESIAKSLENSNQTELVLVGATIATVIFTIVFGVLHYRGSKKQVEESWRRQDSEHFERVRPWIVIEGPVPAQVTLENGNKISWKRYNDTPPRDRQPISIITVIMSFSNTGERPAKNLKKTVNAVNDSFTREELEKKQEEDLHMDLGPNQLTSQTFEIPWESWRKLDEYAIFLGLRVSYDNGKTRSYSGAIFKFSSGQWESIAGWYD
jgi:hypothetical protein